MRFYEFIEPHVSGGTATIRISEEDAIIFQKHVAKMDKGYEYNDDKEALEDFITVNYAYFVGEDNGTQ